MKKGTKKLLGNEVEFETFCNAMLAAANEDALPQGLQITDISKISLNDIADICNDFMQDTGLDMTAHCSVCPECGELHVLLEVNYPFEEEEGEEDNITYLQ